MTRKNIFEIVKENTNITNDVKRITRLFSEDNTCCYMSTNMTIKDFVNIFCFSNWKSRGHCLDVDDFLSTIGYKDVLFKIANCFDSNDECLMLIEIVYNFWKLAENKITGKSEYFSWRGNFYHLYDLMQDILEKINYKAFYNEENEQVLVVEDKPEVTAVAEIVDDDLAMEVIRYNHHTLKGDLNTKKKILISLGREIEPKRKSINNELAENIFYMLNNFNLRHNNVDESNKKKYKKGVAEMVDEELEEWYDELYQMILLAFLELDNKDRAIKFKAIKDKIENTD